VLRPPADGGATSPGGSSPPSIDRAAAPLEPSLTVTDPQGKTLTLTKRPERIVCLNGLCEDVEAIAAMRPDLVIGLPGVHDPLREAVERFAPLWTPDPATWEQCGRVAIPHGDHVDNVHNGHRHAAHEDRYDDH